MIFVALPSIFTSFLRGGLKCAQWGSQNLFCILMYSWFHCFSVFLPALLLWRPPLCALCSLRRIHPLLDNLGLISTCPGEPEMYFYYQYWQREKLGGLIGNENDYFVATQMSQMAIRTQIRFARLPNGPNGGLKLVFCILIWSWFLCFSVFSPALLLWRPPFCALCSLRRIHPLLDNLGLISSCPGEPEMYFHHQYWQREKIGLIDWKSKGSFCGNSNESLVRLEMNI